MKRSTKTELCAQPSGITPRVLACREPDTSNKTSDGRATQILPRCCSITIFRRDPKSQIGRDLRNAQDFKARGVPLDGVGFQMHLTLTPGSLASIEANLRRFTGLGLQVQITELDVRLPVDVSGSASAASLAAQAQIYRDIVSLCLKFPLCTAVQTRGSYG
jgi:hypothetical protein